MFLIALKKYPLPLSYGIICGKCKKSVGIVFTNTTTCKMIDIPPRQYRRYNGKKEIAKEDFSNKSWLNGVNYSLIHKCDGSNYKIYEDDADKIGDYQ